LIITTHVEKQSTWVLKSFCLTGSCQYQLLSFLKSLLAAWLSGLEVSFLWRPCDHNCVI